MADETLKVSTAELRVTAAQIDSHAAEFAEAHQAAHAQAGGVSLGSGQASAALPAMLEAWEERGAAFGTHFVKHAEGHRAAAGDYECTDSESQQGH